MAIANTLDTSRTEGMLQEYDYVSIGQGTASLVVASRLGENPKIRALVVEADPNGADEPRISTPGIANLLQDGPLCDWNHRTASRVFLASSFIP